MGLSWMAWTWPTATFFIVLVLSIVGMGIWEHFSPGGNPRRGLLGLDTTRGDRLFISWLEPDLSILVGWPLPDRHYGEGSRWPLSGLFLSLNLPKSLPDPKKSFS